MPFRRKFVIPLTQLQPVTSAKVESDDAVDMCKGGEKEERVSLITGTSGNGGDAYEEGG